MKKRKDSKYALIWAMAQEYLKLPMGKKDTTKTKEISEAIQKSQKRLIEKMDKIFVGQTKSEEKTVSYRYSKNFFVLAIFISHLKSEDIRINGLSVDTFLKKCNKLQENENQKDAVTWTVIVSFFYEYYYYCQKNDLSDQVINVRNFWIASLNLSHLITNISDSHEESVEWIHKNEWEIKKKLLFYCTSTKVGNISFAGKRMNELIYPLD